MNKKRIWLSIPTVLLPYLVLFTLSTVFLSTKYPFFEAVMEYVFGGNGLYLLVALLLYCVLAVSLSVICFVLSIRKEWDALSLAKCALIIKLIQVPAYILIFVLGVFLVFSIFTIPFSVALCLFDCLTLLLTGLLTAAAAINAVRQGVFQFKEVAWIILLQFVFCADVVASTVFYLKLKKKHNKGK